jgi:RNA polymerase-binding protein DksA
MKKDLLRQFSDQLQKQRRALINEVTGRDQALRSISETREAELEEEAQQERDSRVLEQLDEQQGRRLRDVDDAIARIEAGTYGNCVNCHNPIGEQRLRSTPTTTLCRECAELVEMQSGQPEQGETPEAGRLPPDLEQLDDDELAEHLSELVREGGQVEMDELQIRTHSGVVYLEGAVPSESEHEVLLNVLTDVAGIQEIVDNLDVQRLAWERDSRSKNQPAQDRRPSKSPDQEPYGGTEDINLTKEEGVTYEPPENPPPPPHRKD